MASHRRHPVEVPIHSEPDVSEISSMAMPEEEEWLSEEDASMTSMRRKPAKQRGRASTTATAPKQKSQSNQAAASIPEEEPGQKVKSKKVSTKSKPKQQQLAATTGQLADFPLLGMTKSYDPVFNASWIVHQRMICHKWKALVWMLKVRAAMGLSKMQWRRNPRWLANLYAQELAALWGHVGVCVRSVRGNTGPPLFRAA
jgi:hypothetical protein